MRDIKKQFIGALVLGMTLSGTALSQEQEFVFSGSGGFSSMKYEESDAFKGLDLSLSASYLLWLDSNWGVSLGAELGFYKIGLEESDVSKSYLTRDSEGADFEFRYRVDKYKEDISGRYVGIPLKVQYVSPHINLRNTRIYASAGFRYTMYSKAESAMGLEGVETSGYYEIWDAELHGPHFIGFGAMEDYIHKVKYKLKDSVLLLGEVGVRQELSNRNALYLGVYVNYDLSGKSDTEPLVSYNGSGRGEPLSYQSSLLEKGDRYRLRMLSFGLKLHYALSF